AGIADADFRPARIVGQRAVDQRLGMELQRFGEAVVEGARIQLGEQDAGRDEGDDEPARGQPEQARRDRAAVEQGREHLFEPGLPALGQLELQRAVPLPLFTSRSRRRLAGHQSSWIWYPSPRTVWMQSSGSFLLSLPTKTSIVLLSRSKS